MNLYESIKENFKEDEGYDYWGSKVMEPFKGRAYIQYYGGPGALEYLHKARNGRYVWKDSSFPGDPYIFNSYEDALKVQKEVGGEIMSYERDWLGEDLPEEDLDESAEPIKDLEAMKAYRDECYQDYKSCEDALNDPDLKGQERTELRNELPYLKKKYEEADEDYAKALSQNEQPKEEPKPVNVVGDEENGRPHLRFHCMNCDKPFWVDISDLPEDFYKNPTDINDGIVCSECGSNNWTFDDEIDFC